jgi:FkbM family methyltransferase
MLRNFLLSNRKILLFVLKVYCQIYRIKLDESLHGKVSLTKRDKRIMVSQNHLVYLRDIVPHFSFYFKAVKASVDSTTGREVMSVDYSEPKLQSVTGYNLGELWVPSLPEPIETSDIYVELTRPKEGMTVLDLGSYCGLTAIIFKNAVGSSGTVVSIEADPLNFDCAKKNIEAYEKQTGMGVKLLNRAVWSSNGSVQFLAESGLGSAVAQVLPRSSGKETVCVPTITLSSIVKEFSLPRIDIIKADIEGAEFESFSDAAFFSDHRPVIVFESGGKELRRIRSLLKSYGYVCKTHPQFGARLPLVVCKPV